MGQPAARMGDPTSHGGVITVGCPTVLIGGQPAALRVPVRPTPSSRPVARLC